jgi:hypothetical protein
MSELQGAMRSRCLLMHGHGTVVGRSFDDGSLRGRSRASWRIHTLLGAVSVSYQNEPAI